MANSDIDMNDVELDEEQEDEAVPESKKKVYIPGISRSLKDGEELDYDPEAYRLFHVFETEFPCLSFDVIRDKLGDKRFTFPLECYIVGGTQAEKAKDNQLNIMRLSNLNGIEKKEDDDDDESSDEESDETKEKLPVFYNVAIPQFGDINRIKTETIGSTPVCAIWNDQGRVQIWDLTNPISKLEESTSSTNILKLTSEKPLYSFSGHSTYGFSLGWSPLKNGTLASGDNHKKIFIWNLAEGGKWDVCQRPLTGHESSVEDLQWSSTEEPLLISCSADKSIRLWDVRAPSSQACVHTVPNAHDSDVNVISWNKFEPLIVSGGDDGALKIWSLKTIQYNQSIAIFKQHKAPITSVEWSYDESTTLMASGEDNQITMWDLALESDEHLGENEEKTKIEIPPQLLFVHMGANEIKEVHWHPQITGLALSTALDCFHVFRTINI